MECRRQHSRATEGVPDENLGSGPGLLEMVRSRYQVGDIIAETGAGKVTLTLPQPGEVKTERGDASFGQRRRDPRHCLEVLRAGEAVGKDGVGQRVAGDRQIDLANEFVTLPIRERQLLGAHRSNLMENRDLMTDIRPHTHDTVLRP